MAMLRCKDCGHSVSSSAKACPNCGAKVPRTKWWLWVPLALVAAFFSLPYVLNDGAERKAIQARANCERMFPGERGRQCDRIYDEVLRRERDTAR